MNNSNKPLAKLEANGSPNPQNIALLVRLVQSHSKHMALVVWATILFPLLFFFQTESVSAVTIIVGGTIGTNTVWSAGNVYVVQNDDVTVCRWFSRRELPP